MREYIKVLLAILVCAFFSIAEAREWISRGGRIRVEAEYVETVGNSVRLRKPDGQIITWPLRWLSRGDQEYVKKLDKETVVDVRTKDKVPVTIDTQKTVIRPGPAISNGKLKFTPVTPSMKVAVLQPIGPKPLSVKEKMRLLLESGITDLVPTDLETFRLTARNPTSDHAYVWFQDAREVRTTNGNMAWFCEESGKVILNIYAESGANYLMDFYGYQRVDMVTYRMEGALDATRLRPRVEQYHLLFSFRPIRAGQYEFALHAEREGGLGDEDDGWFFFACEVTKIG